MKDPVNVSEGGTERFVFSDGVDGFEEREFFRVPDSFPWDVEQPNHFLLGELCVEWQNTNTPHVWNDFPCQVPLQFICRTQKPNKNLSAAGFGALITASVVLIDLVVLLAYIKLKRERAGKMFTATSQARNSVL